MGETWFIVAMVSVGVSVLSSAVTIFACLRFAARSRPQAAAHIDYSRAYIPARAYRDGDGRWRVVSEWTLENANPHDTP